jgi:hypothetical protein
MKTRRILKLSLLSILCVSLITIVAQELNYSNKRRNFVEDQQSLFYGGDTLHVITALQLAEGQNLQDGVRRYIESVEGAGGKTIYAGKAMLLARQSKQLPAVEWDAFVITQFSNRNAWDILSGQDNYRSMRAEFSQSYALGMERPVAMNLIVPLALLGTKVGQLLSRKAPRYPFPAPVLPADPQAAAESNAQRAYLQQLVEEHEIYSQDAVLVFNFVKQGSAEQRQANSNYGSNMFSLMAEQGYGPMHLGNAVTLEGSADFDEVVLMYYPGPQYFVDMVQSSFFGGISGDKQLGDTAVTVTVPLLGHL